MSRLLLLLPTTTYRAAAFVEAARRVGVELTVGSDHQSVFAGQAGFLALNLGDPGVAAEQAATFARTHPLAAVFAVDDDTVVAAAAIAARLGLPYISAEAALAARDKHRQRELLSGAGVQVPEFKLLRLRDPISPQLAVRYPCVLKPLRLSASRGVIRADTPEQLGRAVQRLRRILVSPDAAQACGDTVDYALVEDFVPGPEVAIEAVIDQGRMRVLALFDKPDPLDGPFFEETLYVTPSRLPADAQGAVAYCAERAVKALEITRGPVHAELRYNDAGPWLIELAARPIGGRCGQALRFGNERLSLEEVLLRHALGLAVPAWERETGAAGVMMIPVPQAGVLREVRGVSDARAVPGVDDVQITAHPGQELIPWPEGNRYPGFIFARAPDPGRVEAALREAHEKLEWVVDAKD